MTGASCSPCSWLFATLGHARLPRHARCRRRSWRRSPPPASPCCCSSARWASRPRSRCTCGCPTPWPARRRSRPSSTPPRWSPPACSCMTRVNPILAAGFDWAPDLIAWVGVRHRPGRRDDRRGPERHQEGARLLDGEPARLHVPGRRVGGLRGRHLPHGHPRLLQGAAVPRLGLGHPRDARRAGHAADGRPAQVHADHRAPPSSSAGWPSPACRRSPGSGRRTRSCSSPTAKSPGAVGASAWSPPCSPPST